MTNKDYKRLTDVDDRGKPCFTTTFSEETDECLIRHLQRLYDLENAIENGTLVFLPCKVGDEFWYVNKIRKIACIEQVVEFEVGNYGIVIVDTFGRRHSTIERIYFTKEAAKKALEEMTK